MEQKERGSHSFDIELAVEFGSIEKALLFKEIKQMSVYRVRNKKDPFVFYSAEALSLKFPYMKRRSIDRWLKELVESKHLSTQVKNKHKYDKTKSYALLELCQPIGQFGQPIGRDGTTIPPLSTSLSDNAAEPLEVASPSKKELKSPPPSKAEPPPPFDFRAELVKMRADTRIHVRVIARYITARRIRFDSMAELRVAIARHSRAAVQVAKFAKEKIDAAIRDCEALQDIEWTLETVLKMLTKKTYAVAS